MMRYSKLFEVQILHDYHLSLGHVLYEALDEGLRKGTDNKYTINDILLIKPTPETVKIMAGYHMLFKHTARGFFVGIKLDDTAVNDQPAIPLADNLKLRFYIKFKDPRFLNYTALPTNAPQFYRFSNASGNESADQVFLSQAVEAFSTDRLYQANEIYATLSGGTFDLFRAIRDTGPSPSPVGADWGQFPADTLDNQITYSAGDLALSDNSILRALVDDPGNNPGNWETVMLLPNQYVTRADSLLLQAVRFEHDVSSLSIPQATIRIYKRGDSSPILENTYNVDVGNLTTLNIDLSALSAGQYQFELLDDSLTVLPDEGFDFYLDRHAEYEGWFGVIEIGNGSGNFSLLDGSNELRSPIYNIRFLNRTSRWRYIFPEEQAIGAGSEVVPEDGDNRILITDEPRPLTLFGQGALLQTDLPGPPSVNEEIVLPRPETNRIRYQDAQWFSEIHMSNLPL